MKKILSASKSFTAVQIFQVLYWHKRTLFHVFFYIFTMTYTFGCMNHMIKHIYDGGHLKDICLNIAYLLSLSITFAVMHWIKKFKNEMFFMCATMDANPYLALSNRRVQQMFHWHRFMQICIVLYLVIVMSTASFFVEFNNCDEKKNAHVCHYMIPSYFFIEIQKPYQIVYNICTSVCIMYSATGAAVCVILLYSFTVYMEISVDVLISTLNDAQLTMIKSVRQRKIICAYKQHMYMMR